MPFQKGQSGNPGGRKKRTRQEFDLIEAARKRAPEALQVMADIMANGESDRVRLSAAIAIVERAYGSVRPQENKEDNSLTKAVTDLIERLPS